MEDYNIPYWLSQAQNTACESIRVPKKELEERYIRFAVIPQRLFFMTADEDGYVTIASKQIVSMETKLKKAIAKEQLLYKCVERNNLGIEYEKQGEIEKAVELYEENIKPGCYPATQSFDRLLAIYRRTREYKKELRVCKRAISVFKGIDKYTKRLSNIEGIIEKNTKKRG